MHYDTLDIHNNIHCITNDVTLFIDRISIKHRTLVVALLPRGAGEHGCCQEAVLRSESGRRLERRVGRCAGGG